jgi:hypothetical protein
MDGFAFDHLTKRLTLARSRRRALGGLLVGGLDLLGRAPEGAQAHDPTKNCKKKSGKQKKQCLKKAKKHNAAHARETPPSPTCSDGIQNGSESDVDCGGSCQRCVNGKRCTSFRDCQSGRCAPDGTCQPCGDGDCPAGCFCSNSVCGSNAGATPSTDCTCPPGTATCILNVVGSGYFCLPYCNG